MIIKIPKEVRKEIEKASFFMGTKDAKEFVLFSIRDVLLRYKPSEILPRIGDEK